MLLDTTKSCCESFCSSATSENGVLTNKTHSCKLLKRFKFRFFFKNRHDTIFGKGTAPKMISELMNLNFIQFRSCYKYTKSIHFLKVVSQQHYVQYMQFKYPFLAFLLRLLRTNENDRHQQNDNDLSPTPGRQSIS